MTAIITDNPRVKGTKRKWNMVAAANCSRESRIGSIRTPWSQRCFVLLSASFQCALAKVDLLPALAAHMRLIEFIGEYLLFLSAFRAFTNK
jgi:hypothetical protein